MNVTGGNRDALYEAAVAHYGRALDRLATGYEADPDKRRDLRQEIHLRLWQSFEVYDERCALGTWTFRVAHNVAVSYVTRERRRNADWISIEEADIAGERFEPDIDGQRALERLMVLIRKLKPLDRQIILCYLEEMDAAAISAVTGLSPANIAMKVHRIKNVLIQRVTRETGHAGR